MSRTIYIEIPELFTTALRHILACIPLMRPSQWQLLHPMF